MSTLNTTSGGSVYRSSDGLAWSEIGQSQGGFGDANNWGSYAMAAHEGALYLGTFNWTTGTEVWRTTDGTNWVQVNADDPSFIDCTQLIDQHPGWFYDA